MCVWGGWRCVWSAGPKCWLADRPALKRTHANQTKPTRANIGAVWGFFGALLAATWVILAVRKYERR